VAKVQADMLEARARTFMRDVIFDRTPEDYVADPELLVADLAWRIITALCAASHAGVSLDVERAVTVSKELFQHNHPLHQIN
jgi:hypothetical protein